ncbi:D-alanyl-D-alanine carboxypeptidase/D-alanyl-D-alanine endopeptidase [Thalassiella azotivora]
MGRRLVAGALALGVALVGGYAVADVADVVPGVLTDAPLPPPPEPFPTAPGARAPDQPEPVVDAVDASAPVPAPDALGAVLAPLAADPALGPSVSAEVVDALTGDVLWTRDGSVPREPASVVKLLTGAAVLEQLGPAAVTRTRVVSGVTPDEVVLVGGGDVLLAVGEGDPDAVVGRAGLADLADATAAALAAEGRTTVGVRLDDTLFTGPATSPGWSPSDVAAGYVAPVTSVAVDAGRTSAENYAPRQADPALSAATTFAALLAERGVTVAGPVARAVAPPDAPVLAEVESAPLGDVVGHMLRASDNTVAEVLARLVALDLGRPATFADAAPAVLEQVAALGVDTTGARLADGSGLADGSALPAGTLTELLTAAASDDHPRLRPLLTGLPVAGLDGTLGDRFGGQVAAAGQVRAKTGSLTGVTTLAGTVVTADGRLLVFAVLADQAPQTLPARAATDAFAAALVACGCR